MMETLETRARTMARRLPAPIKRTLRRWTGKGTAVGPVRWGHLRRTEPLDRNWGYGRGTPVDRVYIEEFLEAHSADVRGVCLEVLDPTYTRRFGGERVLTSDVLDVDAANPHANVIADLGDAGSLPEHRYDCFIMTQTLHLVPDMASAISNAHRALAPGGVLLLTVPGIGRHEHRPGLEHDCWRLTPAGLSWLLRSGGWMEGTVTSFGNVLTATAILFGIAAEELKPEEFAVRDLDYPVVVACRAVKTTA